MEITYRHGGMTTDPPLRRFDLIRLTRKDGGQVREWRDAEMTGDAGTYWIDGELFSSHDWHLRIETAYARNEYGRCAP